MTDHAAIVLMINVRPNLLRIDTTRSGEEGEQFIAAGGIDDRRRGVQLDAVAGGKQNDLATGKPRFACGQGLALLHRVECQLLADGQRRGGMIQSQEDQPMHQWAPPAGMNWTAIRVPIIRTKPRMLSIAA